MIINFTNISSKDFHKAVACGFIDASIGFPKRGRRTCQKPASRYKIKNIPIEKRLSKFTDIPILEYNVRCAHCRIRVKPQGTRWYYYTCSVELCLTNNSNYYLECHKLFFIRFLSRCS